MHLWTALLGGQGLRAATQVIREGCKACVRIARQGSLPSTLQHYTSYAGGSVAASRERDGAKAFIDFLTSPQAQTFRSFR